MSALEFGEANKWLGCEKLVRSKCFDERKGRNPLIGQITIVDPVSSYRPLLKLAATFSGWPQL